MKFFYNLGAWYILALAGEKTYLGGLWPSKAETNLISYRDLLEY